MIAKSEVTAGEMVDVRVYYLVDNATRIRRWSVVFNSTVYFLDIFSVIFPVLIFRASNAPVYPT